MTHQDKRPPVAAIPARITTHAEAIAAARDLAADWAPKAARDAERILPHAEMQAFSDSGLGAITVPAAHGGPGLGRRTLVELFEILCAADSSAGQVPQNHFGVLQLLDEAGSDDQKRRWFGDVLAGQRIGNAGPEKGRQPITHNRTGLHRTPEGLRLSGRVDAVQGVIADGVVFPAHRIVQRMGADIAPVAVQIIRRHGGRGAGQLEQLVGGQQPRHGAI